MSSAIDLPFQVFNAPNFKIRIPWGLFTPSAMTVFSLVFLSYFVFLSGVIYDVITETPSLGTERDPHTGAIKPVAILAGRINSQFIIEGLTAGALFCMGGISFIALDAASAKDLSETNRFMLFGAAGLLLFVAYNLCIVFIRIKVPGYLS